MDTLTIKKVVVIGPESTGKSTLSELLAQEFNTSWCPEFAREYLMTNGSDYDFQDLLYIAQGQLALEEEFENNIRSKWSVSADHHFINANKLNYSQKEPVLFIDTDMYVMKVWNEYVFGKCHQYILDAIVSRKYDLYLLCNIDLPWVKDDLREYPDEALRKELYNMYKDLLINQDTPWVEIKGDYNARLETAISAVNDIL